MTPDQFPLSERSCRCGGLLDVCGLYRAACARAGMLGRRVLSLESVGEAQGCFRTNMIMRNMDLACPALADRRFEVVVERSWHSAPLWCKCCTQTVLSETACSSKGWRAAPGGKTEESGHFQRVGGLLQPRQACGVGGRSSTSARFVFKHVGPFDPLTLKPKP